METIQESPEQIETNLAQFMGGDDMYRHTFGMLYTSGVHYLAESCGAYWLLDVVASYQSNKCRRDPMLR